MRSDDGNWHLAPDYLVARAQRALAEDARTLELGLSIVVRESQVFVTGTVASESRRGAVTDVLSDALPGLLVHNQVSVLRLDEGHEDERLE